MDDNYIILSINNVEYYITADRVHDLVFLDNKLVNISQSNITLVTDFDYQNTYPRITCGSMSACILKSSSQATYQYVTSQPVYPNKFNMNTLNRSMQSNIIIGLFVILLGIKLLWKK